MYGGSNRENQMNPTYLLPIYQATPCLPEQSHLTLTERLLAHTRQLTDVLQLIPFSQYWRLVEVLYSIGFLDTFAIWFHP